MSNKKRNNKKQNDKKQNRKTNEKNEKNDNKKKEGYENYDPLNSEGKGINQITNMKYTDNYIKNAPRWSNLPIYKNKTELMKIYESIDNNQVTLIESGTGSGKTVLMPMILLNYFKNKSTDNKDKQNKHNIIEEYKNTLIYITLPKIITVIESASYCAQNLDVELGTYVGYKFRGSPENMMSSKTNLLYCTDGTVTSMINAGNTELTGLSGIIIDEVHERSENIDLILFLLKNVLKNRPEFKVIIMSATLDVEVFKRFYEKDKIKFGHVLVSGKSNYPITSHFLQQEDKINYFNYMDVGISIILQILNEHDGEEGDILMFVSTTAEANKGCSMLKKLCGERMNIASRCESYYCAELYADIEEDKKRLALSSELYKEKDPKYRRKIIFATNVAESSLTVDGIVYVIDSGLELDVGMNYLTRFTQIGKQYTTISQIKQRMGRAGRTKPGECYHLYTRNKFESLKSYAEPSILTSNSVHMNVLRLIRTYKTVYNFLEIAQRLIQPLTVIQCKYAIKLLHTSGMIKMVSFKQLGGNLISVAEDEYKCDGKTNLDIDIINYTNIDSYKDLMKFDGCINKLGKLILKMDMYDIETSLMLLYSKYFNLTYEMVPMISFMIASKMDINKIIKYPHTIMNDMNMKMNFINENFKDAIDYKYSDHLFIYHLINLYYSNGRSLNLFNERTISEAITIQENIQKILLDIKMEVLEEIIISNELIDKMIVSELKNDIERIYYILYLSNKANLITTVEDGKKMYRTIYNIENTSCNTTFMYCKGIEETMNYKYGITNGLLNFNGKESMTKITLFPNELSYHFKLNI